MFLHFINGIASLGPIQVSIFFELSTSQASLDCALGSSAYFTIKTCRKEYYKDCNWAAVGAQLTEQPILTPKVSCLSPVIGNLFQNMHLLLSVEKRPGMAH